MQFVLARLKEPGTLRSLAVVLFAILGIVPDDNLMQSVVSLAILVLGSWSALMPEKAAQAAEKVEAAASEVTDAARATQQAAARVVGAAKGLGL